jgi:hypothetical protein
MDVLISAYPKLQYRVPDILDQHLFSAYEDSSHVLKNRMHRIIKKKDDGIDISFGIEAD